MFSDHAIERFADRRDAGNVLVEPKRPTFPVREGAEDGVRGGIHVAVRVDELHSLGALFAR